MIISDVYYSRLIIHPFKPFLLLLLGGAFSLPKILPNLDLLHMTSFCLIIIRYFNNSAESMPLKYPVLIVNIPDGTHCDFMKLSAAFSE